MTVLSWSAVISDIGCLLRGGHVHPGDVGIGANSYDIHDLRFAAASKRAEAGCANERIAAVTGYVTEHWFANNSRAIKAQRMRR
ncbi:hypothetical protein [Falsirhodobacter halotolerans]|uniref:hypothetical protein n=1 Tax=Falsirhodobacter halotolerans TaxID=1146892 RepID=UPI001FD3881A|nr:hypothetical protein [Falsirhodobacter halotolerans]MCJ8139861.1 hypothetical protein [Falsirhodobacter halotolerans]